MTHRSDTLIVNAPDFFVEKRPHNGLTYDEYVSQWKEKLAQSLKGLDRVARRYYFYAKYNDERALRVEEAYTMSDEFEKAIDAIEKPQLWMILTEDWCLDSAYALPIIYAAAQRNSLINIRILPRDSNLDIMDRYLTKDARSIPKVVAFTMEGEEMWTWGPRPGVLQAMRKSWKEGGEPGNVISQRSVEWYEEGGWKVIETELTEALKGL